MAAPNLLEIVSRAQTLLPATTVNILKVDSRAEWSHLDGAPVASNSLLRSIDRQPLRVADVQREYPDVAGKIRGALVIPILYESILWGVLMAESNRTNAFNAQHEMIAQTLAEKAALLMTVDRHHKQQEATATSLQYAWQELAIHHEVARLSAQGANWRDILPDMASQIAGLFVADGCAIILWDDQVEQMRQAAAWGIENPGFSSMLAASTPIVKQVLDTRQPLFSSAAEDELLIKHGVKAIVVVPLLARGNCLGAVLLMRLVDEKPFSARTVSMATPSLNQLALMIDNQLLLSDTTEQLQQTQMLLDVAAIAAGSLDLDHMLKQVLMETRHILQIKAAAVLFYSEPERGFLLRSGYGNFGFRTLHNDAHFPVDNVKNPLVEVYYSGQGRFVDDVSQLPSRFRELEDGTAIQNALIAPLMVQDFFEGALLVANKPGDFTRLDMSLVMAMGSHIAGAIRSTQLLTDTRTRLRETEALRRMATITSGTLHLDEMMEIAVTEAVKLFEAEGGELLMPDANGAYLIPHESSLVGVVKEWPVQTFDLNSVLSGHQVQVFKSGKPYFSNEAPTTPLNPRRNILTVPLVSRQKTVGVLSIVNRKDGNFTDSQAELAVAMASQMAVSIESAELFSSERQRAELMFLINHISREMSGTLDIAGLLRQVVSSVHEIIGYDGVFISLVNDAKDQFVQQAGITDAQEYAPSPWPDFLNDMIRNVISTGLSRILPDIELDPFRSGLVVALQHGEEVYGMMTFLSQRRDVFNNVSQMAMENLASQVSISVENARLYAQVQRRLLEQGIVHQIGQDLAAILDYSVLTHVISRHMARALDTSVCLVASFNPEDHTITLEADYRLPGYERINMPLKVGEAYTLDRIPIAREAVRTKRPVAAYIDDESIPVEQRAQLEYTGNQSELVVPMMIGERIIGMVGWGEQRKARRFNTDDGRLAQTLVAQAAIAVENARLFREAERRAREQALLRQVAVAFASAEDLQHLLTILINELRGALEVSDMVVSLMDTYSHRLTVREIVVTQRTKQDMVLTRLTDPDQQAPYIWEALQAGERVFIRPDMDEFSLAQQELLELSRFANAMVILTPLGYRGQLLGVVEVCTAPTSGDDHMLQLLEGLSNQAGIAIENARFSEREQQRLFQMERLQVSGRRISSEVVLQKLKDLVVKESAAIFESSAAAMLMPDELGLRYVPHAAHGLSDKFVEEWYLLIGDDDPNDAEPLYLLSLSEYANEKQTQLLAAEGILSALRIPMVKGSKLFGYIELYKQDNLRYFTDQDIEVAAFFGSQVAIALDNAKLFMALEARAEELEEMNRLKSQFLANVSHELRTPMNIILGFTDMLLGNAYGDLNDKQESRLERILQNAHSLLSLIDDLLDLSKVDAGRMELDLKPIDVEQEINEALSVFESQAEQRSLYLKTELDNLPSAMADPLRFRQVLTNLVGNAIKFTEQGGITVKAEPHKETVLSPQPGEEAVKDVIWISVVDTGIGIKLEDQLVIFDEFRQADGSATREYGGTGLGLAICKRLLEMMGGRIWVDSEEGQGSTFTFVLPVVSNT